MEEKEKNSSISLGDILRVVWKNIILIAIITLFVTLIGAVYSFKIVKPTYKSTSTIIVATASSGDSSSFDSTNTLRITETVANLAETRAVLVPVAQKLGATTDEEINSLVSTLASESSETYSTTNYIVTITVVDHSGKTAMNYANLIAESLKDYVNDTDSLKAYNTTLTVISPAATYSYNSPNKTLYVIVAFLLGAVIALVIVFFKEFMSTKFKTRDEIALATDNKIIGTFVDNKKREATEIATLVEPNIREFEPYNNLFTNVKYANLDNPYKVIMFTSTVEDELKSTTSANFAYAIKNNDKKVIIIDLDLRKPVIHTMFKVTRSKGIVEYIAGTIAKDDVIKKSEFGVDVISAGTEVLNPYVVIDSPKLKALIDELREEYDYIIVDTPPLAVCGDGRNVAKICDGIVYNVTINQVRKKLFLETASNLNEQGLNVIGFNVTKLPVSRFDKASYYYSGKYYVDENPNKTELKSDQPAE